MKRILSLIVLLLSFNSGNANAWFFFFLPGIGSSGDSTDICISSEKKVGDTFNSASGNVATVKSISGTSSACKKPETPIRAHVEFSYSFNSKAGINVPDGYKSQNLPELERFNGSLMFALNNDTDSGFKVNATKRDVISDMMTYATNLEAAQAKLLDESQPSEIEQTTVNGLKAWRFEVKGKLKNLFGTKYTYLMTILEGGEEVVTVIAWTRTGNYERQKEELKKLAEGINGIVVPNPVMLNPPSLSPSSIETKPQAASSSAALTSSSLQPQIKSVANRLRDLKALYKDGVLNKKDYEAKKKEILDSM
jgi:hypothetical protein